MSKRSGLIVASLAGIAVLAVVVVAAYVLRPTAAPSGEFTAIPIQPSATAEQIADTEVPTEAPATEAPTEEAVALLDQTFLIDSSQSEARFEVGEVLSGSDNLVVGVSDQVAGQIQVDFADPANTQIGVVQIDARAFATDNGFRNRAINNQILQTGPYEFITFTPNAITGLPDSVAVGDTLNFQVVGDLTIRDITQEVAFDLVVNVVAADRLEGEASAIIARADYQLAIPNVPQVASVDENVNLFLDFVATPES